MENPPIKYKCGACGKVWRLDELNVDPTSLCGGRNRCCGDFFCGANCYPVTNAGRTRNVDDAQLRALLITANRTRSAHDAAHKHYATMQASHGRDSDECHAAYMATFPTGTARQKALDTYRHAQTIRRAEQGLRR